MLLTRFLRDSKMFFRQKGDSTMRRIFNWDKKYLYWGVTAYCVIA